jgi:hypothetical protein
MIAIADLHEALDLGNFTEAGLKTRYLEILSCSTWSIAMTIAITPIMGFGLSGNGRVMPYWPPNLLWISAAWVSTQ